MIVMLDKKELIQKNLDEIRSNFSLIRRGFDYKVIKSEIIVLKEKTSDPNIWEKKEAKNIFQDLKLKQKKLMIMIN